jgi:molybdopterin molybdotransferase
MLTLDQARQRILDAVTVCPVVEVSLASARGLVLAEAAIADEPIPNFAHAGAEGYAVRAEDITDASPDDPDYLTVIGTARPGAATALVVQPGEAVRVYTGASLPDGANAIVKLEFARPAGPDMVEVDHAVPRGQYVKPVGNDVASGTVVLPAETPLTAAAIGMLAAMGRNRVKVHRRPRIAVLSTGDELVRPGEKRKDGQIYDTNSEALAAQIAEAGGELASSVLVRDTAPALRSALMELPPCEAVVCSGGVSVGDFDYVRDVVGQLGDVEFDQVAMRPGGPFAFGTLDGRLFYGLPGSPVGSYAAFELLVRPAVRKMLGFSRVLRPEVCATLDERLTHTRGRREYMRAQTVFGPEGAVVRVIGDHDNAIMSSMALANSLVVVPEDTAELPAGSTVRVLWLSEL